MAVLNIFFGSRRSSQPSATSGPRPSGGIPATLKVKGRTKKDITEARKRYGFDDPEAAQVIDDVAARQAERNEQDAQKRFEELSRELELRRIRWDGRYLEVLDEVRARLIDEEIAELMRVKQLKDKQLREDEEMIVLLMLAAAVA